MWTTKEAYSSDSLSVVSAKTDYCKSSKLIENACLLIHALIIPVLIASHSHSVVVDRNCMGVRENLIV